MRHLEKKHLNHLNIYDGSYRKSQITLLAKKDNDMIHQHLTLKQSWNPSQMIHLSKNVGLSSSKLQKPSDWRCLRWTPKPIKIHQMLAVDSVTKNPPKKSLSMSTTQRLRLLEMQKCIQMHFKWFIYMVDQKAIQKTKKKGLTKSRKKCVVFTVVQSNKIHKQKVVKPFYQHK